MKSDLQTRHLYESPALQEVIGPALRPGGLALTSRALAFCDLPVGSPVIDIGCGTGVTVHFLQRHYRLRAFGLDCSSGMLGQARRREPNLPLIQGIATRLPFGDCRLAGVICECVLSLLENAANAWREFYRVLRPGGYLVLADVYARVPEYAGLLKSIPVSCCLKGAQPRDDLVDRLKQGGFTLLAWEDHSEDLKHLAAQLALAGWPPQALRPTFGPCDSAPDVQNAIQRARPGYFLMVAFKRGKR